MVLTVLVHSPAATALVALIAKIVVVVDPVALVWIRVGRLSCEAAIGVALDNHILTALAHLSPEFAAIFTLVASNVISFLVIIDPVALVIVVEGCLIIRNAVIAVTIFQLVNDSVCNLLDFSGIFDFLLVNHSLCNVPDFFGIIEDCLI